MITQERAKEIQSQCQKLAKSGSWAEHLNKILSPDEHQAVLKLLGTLSPNTAYVHAFYRFLNGTADGGL